MFWAVLLLAIQANAISMYDISPHYPALSSPVLSETVYNVTLEQNGYIQMSWWLQRDEKKVTFSIHFTSDVPSFEWFFLGWSDRGEFSNADFCVLSLYQAHVGLQDLYSDENGQFFTDEKQNCNEFKWDDNQRTLTFSRLYDTCDDNDYIFDTGTTHLIWGYGTVSDSKESPELLKNADAHGMTRVQLIKSLQKPPPTASRQYTVNTNNVKVPDSDTTYWCHVHKLPDWLWKARHHIIQFQSKITPGNEGLVHHMEVFYCDAASDAIIDNYEGSCFSPNRPNSTYVCSKVKAAWAMGAAPFSYPVKAGLPIGGVDKNQYVMLEVHYNNPQMISTYVDSSGILISVTPHLRKYDAAIMELGLEYTDKMAIPPRMKQFDLSGYCTSACTDIGLPERGIVVFGSQLHTHLTGVQVNTRHFRHGVELPELNRDDHYSTHFQEIRLLNQPVHIKPGDFLITTCKYQTLDRENVTFGGHAITDEMCVNYIHYYPATSLEVCKSSVGSEALASYFKFENKWENKNTQLNQTNRQNYGNIGPWSPLQSDFLKDLYLNSPISMQCNSSNGDRFPGEWDNVLQDPIVVGLPPPNRDCPIDSY